MFDLWKIQFSGGSSVLLDEVSQLTFDKFAESLTPEKVRADFAWQLISTGVALGVGALAGKLGFALTYAGMNIWKGVVDQMEQDNLIASKTYHDENYRGKKSLSETPWYDDFFGDSITTAFIGNPFGVYAPVVFETEKYKYEGQVVLAPMGGSKTKSIEESFLSSGLQAKYVYTPLDFSLQTRNYLGYSDLTDVRCQGLIDDDLMVDYWVESALSIDFGMSGSPYEIAYEGLTHYQENLDVFSRLWNAPHSITYLENNAALSTKQNQDDDLNKIIPYMDDYYPTLLLSDVNNIKTLPEFYEDYPIIVSEEVYDDICDELFDRELDSFYKVWEKGEGQDLRIIPGGSTHTLKADIDHINVYVCTYKTGGDKASFGYDKFDTLESDDYAFDENSGQIIFDSSIIEKFKGKIDEKEDVNSNYQYCIVLEIFVEKFRSINDTKDLTTEEMKQIASMQAIQVAVLEYYYQFQLAVQSQSKINEIAYTVALTAATTAILCPQQILSETLEELFLDPLIEASVSGITREIGKAMGIEDTTYAEIVFSTMAETGRETAMGLGTTFNEQSQWRQNRYIHKIFKKITAYQQQQAAAHQNNIIEEVKQSSEQDTSDTAQTSLIIFGRAIQQAAIYAKLRNMDVKQRKQIAKLPAKQILAILTGKEAVDFDLDSKLPAPNPFYMGDDDDEGTIVYNERLNALIRLNMLSGNRLNSISDEKKQRQLPKGLWEKTVRMVQAQSLNILQDSKGIWTLDPYMIARDILQEQGYDISNTLFAGNMAPRFIASADSIEKYITLISLYINDFQHCLRSNNLIEALDILDVKSDVSRKIIQDILDSGNKVKIQLAKHILNKILDLKITKKLPADAIIGNTESLKIWQKGFYKKLKSGSFRGVVYKVYFNLPGTVYDYKNSHYIGNQYIGATGRMNPKIRFYEEIWQALEATQDTRQKKITQWLLHPTPQNLPILTTKNKYFKAIIFAMRFSGITVKEILDYKKQIDAHPSKKWDIAMKIADRLETSNIVKFTPIEVTESLDYAFKRERQLVLAYQKRKGSIDTLLNSIVPAGVFAASIDLPWFDIAIMIAMGYPIKQIAEHLSNEYPEYHGIHRNTITRGIEELFGDFYQAQEELLGGSIEYLLDFSEELLGRESGAVRRYLQIQHDIRIHRTVYYKAKKDITWFYQYLWGSVGLKFDQDKVKSLIDRLPPAKIDPHTVNRIVNAYSLRLYGQPRITWYKWAIENKDDVSIANELNINRKTVSKIWDTLLEDILQDTQIPNLILATNSKEAIKSYLRSQIAIALLQRGVSMDYIWTYVFGESVTPYQAQKRDEFFQKLALGSYLHSEDVLLGFYDTFWLEFHEILYNAPSGII